MIQKIKLMPDYYCYPLWGLDPDNIGDIDPEKLPLLPETINRLKAYSEAYQAGLNWDYPPDSPEPTKEEIESYEQEGISIWHQLRQELAPDYEVHYFSQKLRKVIGHPSELMATV
ncbi:hypothetical protein [Phormidium nigroviride]